MYRHLFRQTAGFPFVFCLLFLSSFSSSLSTVSAQIDTELTHPKLRSQIGGVFGTMTVSGDMVVVSEGQRVKLFRLMDTGNLEELGTSELLEFLPASLEYHEGYIAISSVAPGKRKVDQDKQGLVTILDARQPWAIAVVERIWIPYQIAPGISITEDGVLIVSFAHHLKSFVLENGESRGARSVDQMDLVAYCDQIAGRGSLIALACRKELILLSVDAAGTLGKADRIDLAHRISQLLIRDDQVELYFQVFEDRCRPWKCIFRSLADISTLQDPNASKFLDLELIALDQADIRFYPFGFRPDRLWSSWNNTLLATRAGRLYELRPKSSSGSTLYRIVDLGIRASHLKFSPNHQRLIALDTDPTGNLGLQVLDIGSADLSLAPLLGRSKPELIPHQLVVEGHWAFMIDVVEPHRIISVDLQNPDNPVSYHHDIVAPSAVMTYSDHFVFLADHKQLIVYDAKDPWLIRKLASIPIAILPLSISVEDRFLLIGENASSNSTGIVIIFDISNPSSPRLLHEVRCGQKIHVHAIHDSVAFLSSYAYNGSGTRWYPSFHSFILDLDRPHPVCRTWVDHDVPNDVSIDADLLATGTRLWRITNPRQPIHADPVGDHVLGLPKDVWLNRNLYYAGFEKGGASATDISTFLPKWHQIIFDDMDKVSEVEGNQDLVIFADRFTGLWVYDQPRDPLFAPSPLPTHPQPEPTATPSTMFHGYLPFISDPWPSFR